MNQIVLPECRPSMPDNEALYEIVRGQRVELPPMSVYASWATGQLDRRLGPYVETHKLGWVIPEGLFIFDVELDERRRPDLAYVSAARWPLDRLLPETGDWAIVPDLAVEVISPNELFEAVLAKLQEYFDFGVQQVWLVVPKARKIYVYDSPTRVRVLTDADTLENTVVPGFTLQIGELFQKAR